MRKKTGYQPGRVVSAIVIKEDTDLEVPAGVSGVVLGNERRRIPQQLSDAGPLSSAVSGAAWVETGDTGASEALVQLNRH